ncbi:DUF2381 family protein [Corallococcus exiguus]|uniref:DUF2381 family protein n=1 Tax=Corallococcus TaxID=83461 RepID=UPI0011C411F2|nr:DUF2381 family protein [Corallococcus sp. AB038B]NPC75710.1 DUF2381 family protein [Corallococcus exiguus]
MLTPRVVVCPILLMLLGAAVPAWAGAPGPRVPRERKLVVRAEEATTLHLLRVAPGTVTTVVFNEDILPQSVDTKALAPLFGQLKVYPGVMVLRPTVAMPETSRPLITARFAGEDAPRQVSFLLVTDPKEVDTVVEVSRHALSAEDLGEELSLLRGRCVAAEAGLATLRAQCAQSGLAGAVLTGALGPEPVSVERPPTAVGTPGLTVVVRALLYRHIRTRLMAFSLRNSPDAAAWVPGEGRLIQLGPNEQEGQVIQREIPVRMLEARLAPGASGQMVLEWHMPEDLDPRARYVLEVWNQEGNRSVRWEGLSL